MADQVASNQKLIEGCLLWDKITRELQKAVVTTRAGVLIHPEIDLRDLAPEGSQIYSERDYAPLACRIDADKAEMTVGSSPGHAVHIELDRGSVRYYDTDTAVNEIMKDLFEAEADLKCKVSVDGVDCEGLKSKIGEPERGYLPQIRALFRVLAMPTSMDTRQDFCQFVKGNDRAYCRGREKQLFKQVKKAYPE